MRADEFDDGPLSEADDPAGAAESADAAAARADGAVARAGATARADAAPAHADVAAARAAAARAAAARLEPGTTIGLGSGRAVAAVIDEAARRWPEGPPLLAAVASSATDRLARAAGFAVVSLDDLDLKRGTSGPARSTALLDLVIDGADEVDPQLDLLKGGGGALLRERLLADAARRFLIVIEDEKLVDRLGEQHALPVEIVRFGWRQTRRRILRLLPEARLRHGDDGRAFVTDEGHFIVDCDLPAGGGEGLAGEGLAALAAALKALPGVVDHGLFLGMADEVVVGRPDGGVETRVRGA